MTSRSVQCLLPCLIFTAEVAALTVQAPPGSMPYSAARVQGTLALAAPVADMEEAVELLGTSPMSCVSFDAAKGFAYFSVRPEDYYDQRRHRARRDNTSNLACRDIRRASATLMVPTYLGHQAMYNRLMESVQKNVTSRTTLVSIFSSVKESVWMTGNCSTCATTPLLSMRALIFDYSYKHYVHNGRKFNYQTAKKLWALNHVEYDNVLMLDSDFSFLRPVMLEKVLAPYLHVVYEKPCVDPYCQGMLQGLSVRFNSTALSYAPFELPWIYDKRMVSRLIDHLGPRYVDDIFFNKGVIFEVFLYRVFVLAHDPAFFNKHIPTTRLWFEDPDVAESERLALDPPPIAVRHSLQEKQPCRICWLEAHADRKSK